jgi:hypothetical protein
MSCEDKEVAMRAKDSVPMALTVLVLMISVPVEAESSKAAGRPIYRCQIDGVTTFSDRACGETIELYKLEMDNAAQPVRKTETPQAARPKVSPPKRLAKPQEPSKTRSEETCARLNETLENLKSRLRAGYSAKEGEQLHARLARAEDRRRAQKCQSTRGASRAVVGK